MIRNKTPKEKPVIDLTGPEGNAFALMGYAQDLCRQLKIEFNLILDDMMSGDYEHLVGVMEKHFGDYIIMER